MLNLSVSACAADNVNPTARDRGRAPEPAAGLSGCPEHAQRSVFLWLCLPLERQEFGGVQAD